MNNASQRYYGGFFWLATISFIVPLFVAFAAFDKLSPSTKPASQPDASGVDHNLWDYLLRKYVENGLVDYAGISKDYLFTQYIQQIAACDPSKLSTTDEKLALHCNAYNALVIQGVINHKIHQNERNVLNFTPKSIADKIKAIDLEVEVLKRRRESDPQRIEQLMEQADQLRTDSQFFRLREHIFANQTLSLDELEQEKIRPVFQDPRIHVALVCAAQSCPAIRPEAYQGIRLQEQLQDQAFQFANNTTYVSFSRIDNSLQLSPILSWYATDWDGAGGVLTWLTSYVADAELKAKIEAANEGDVPVAYNTYDWNLNSQETNANSSASTSASFGSGSVPNE